MIVNKILINGSFHPDLTGLENYNVMGFSLNNDNETYTLQLENKFDWQTVTAIQFLTQLELEGITQDAILQVIETLEAPNNIMARVSFLRATSFDRDSSFISLVGAAFEKTELELNDIFINANNLNF